MKLVVAFIRVALTLGALAMAAAAIAGLFGSMVPELDLINHFQILLLPATILGLVVLAVVLRGSVRGAALVFGIAGLAASASIVVPEALAARRNLRPAPDEGTVRLMTHNLFGMNYEMERVVAAIMAEDPDIIVLQEYFGEQATDLHPLLLAKYPFFVRCRGGKRANLGLYSRLPFSQLDEDACPNDAYGAERTAHILAEFTLEGDKSFSVLTSHMDWPYPVARQQGELAQLAEVVGRIQGPVILAGDFNSTPWSYTLRQFVAETGLHRQTLSLFTFPMRFYYFGAWRDTLPFLPLDHVLTRGLNVHSVDTGGRTASDHLPVVVEFSVE